MKGVTGALTETAEFGGLRSMVVTASNFGLAMNGCHYFEAFRYLTNEEVAEISCWFDPNNVPNPRGPQYVDRSGQLRGITACRVRTRDGTCRDPRSRYLEQRG